MTIVFKTIHFEDYTWSGRARKAWRSMVGLYSPIAHHMWAFFHSNYSSNCQGKCVENSVGWGPGGMATPGPYVVSHVGHTIIRQNNDIVWAILPASWDSTFHLCGLSCVRTPVVFMCSCRDWGLDPWILRWKVGFSTNWGWEALVFEGTRGIYKSHLQLFHGGLNFHSGFFLLEMKSYLMVQKAKHHVFLAAIKTPF